MNKKASSSGAITPPSASELLEAYTPEQLRAHWLSLGLDAKAVSFAPKAFDTSISKAGKDGEDDLLVRDDPRVVDPALKESAFLTNIFNRLARSCFYGAARASSSTLPAQDPSDEVREFCREALLAYEQSCYVFNAHEALSVAEEFGRAANKRWDDASKLAKDDDEAYLQALANAFFELKTLTLLMHPVVPSGCECIARMLGFDAALFFSWEHAFEGPVELAQLMGQTAQEHAIEELPPRFDFFEKHPSQVK